MAISHIPFLASLLLLLYTVDSSGGEGLEIVISSLLPTTTCSPFTQGLNSSRKLQIVHKNGPCSTLSQEKNTIPISSYQIFLRDQLRLNSLRSRFSKHLQGQLPKKAIIPANPTDGGSSFYVTIGIGTPMQIQSLDFDTGSDLTWVQCKPCAICHPQAQPLFDPSLSSSYSSISCDSAECSLVSDSTQTCSSTCTYSIAYEDRSVSEGVFGSETLKLTPSDVFPNFLFGCGLNNSGIFANTAGILGLAPSEVSLVSQTATEFGKLFSYCLPSTTSSTGFLAFGAQTGASSSQVQYTPLLTINNEVRGSYFVQLVGISVNGKVLSIPPSAFFTSNDKPPIVDSGTTLTYLTWSAYTALKLAFQQAMSNYSTAPPVNPLDTCYDFSGYSKVLVPRIVLNFQGGAYLLVHPSGVFFLDSPTQTYCLAFVGNKNLQDPIILGNQIQKTYEVIHDVAGKRLGFRPGGCS